MSVLNKALKMAKKTMGQEFVLKGQVFDAKLAFSKYAKSLLRNRRSYVLIHHDYVWTKDNCPSCGVYVGLSNIFTPGLIDIFVDFFEFPKERVLVYFWLCSECAEEMDDISLVYTYEFSEKAANVVLEAWKKEIA